MILGFFFYSTVFKPRNNGKVRQKMKNGLATAIVENVVFLLEFAAVIIGMVLIAYALEKVSRKKAGDDGKERVLSTRRIAVIGMFSAMAAILMLFEIPLPFAPSFYKLDFSELPALVGTFAFGPVAGVMIEFVKIVLKLVMKGTSTAFVGELANFTVGCSFLLPAALCYMLKKTRKNAIIGCIAGTLMLTFVGTSFNAVYLLPKFAQLFGMPLDAIIGMGTAINPKITSVTSFVIFAVAPLNLIKGSLVSIITLLIYKKISPIIKK